MFIYYLGICSKAIGIDDEDKILESVKILNDRDSEIEQFFIVECSKSLNEMLAAKEDEESNNKKVCLLKFTNKFFFYTFINNVLYFRQKKSRGIR